jgi:WD40 repeat protein
MAINFPNNPSQGETYDDPVSSLRYSYDGEKWLTAGYSPTFVKTSGDTMTGDLTAPNITVPGTITATQAPAVLLNFGINMANTITINSSFNVASVEYNGALGQYKINYTTPISGTAVASLLGTVGVVNGGASYCNVLTGTAMQSTIATLSVQPNGTLAAEASSFYNYVVWDV